MRKRCGRKLVCFLLMLVVWGIGVQLTAQSEGSPLKLLRVVRIDDDVFNWNTAPFDQDKIRTFGDFQYTLLWDVDRTLVVVRRDLRDHSVQTVRLEDRVLPDIPITSGHRNTVIGTSAEDGRLHLSWNNRKSPLRYGASRPGFLTNPPKTMTVTDFEPQRTLISSDLRESSYEGFPITYPQFLSNPPRSLHFIHRQGWPGDGDHHLYGYDAKTHTWSHLGMLLSRYGVHPTWDGGRSRCAYLNEVLMDTKGRLHMTWCWREKGETWASNHGLYYAYSDDGGATWKNNAGEQIANLPKGDPIELADPGLGVWDIPVYSWMMNQTAMTLDADNQPHVVTYHLATPERPEILEHCPPREIADKLQIFHYWRTADGKWHRNLIAPGQARPGLVFDQSGNLIVYRARGGKLKVHVALGSDGWQTWRHFEIDIPGINLAAESKPDLKLLKRDGILSFVALTREAEGKFGFALVDFDFAITTTVEEEKP